MMKLYEKYYDMYMRNVVTLASLEKLVKANLLTQAEVNKMKYERQLQYNY